MTPTTAADRFRRDGYVLIEGFFDRAMMDDLERACLDHFGVQAASLHSQEFVRHTKVEVTHWFPQHDGRSGFDQPADDPRLHELTTAILGPDWRADSCLAMHSNPGSGGQAWHQDCPPDRHHLANLNRLVYPRAVGGERGGALTLVPGSHRRGMLPTGDPSGELPGQITLQPGLGALVLVDGHCWHRVEPVGREHRNSINYRALPAGAPADLTDICLYRNLRYRFSTESVMTRRHEHAI